MNLNDLGEFGVIEKLRKKIRIKRKEVLLGIGDDAAVCRGSAGDYVYTTDTLIEKIHFQKELIPPFSLGWKACAVNLSDIAAMGARPLYLLISLSLSDKTRMSWVDDLYEGLLRLSSLHDTDIIGGDFTGTPGPAVIGITAVGRCKEGGAVLRMNTSPGELIGVTGTLGDSACGCAILLRDGKKRPQGLKEGDLLYLTERHMKPEPRVAEGAALGEEGLCSSMIDISDGLVKSLFLLNKEGCGALINEEALPLSESLRNFTSSRKMSFSSPALYGGEDYELLFSFPKDKLGRIESVFGELGTRFTVIGEVTDKRGVLLRENGGEIKSLKEGGYDHFRKE